MGHTARMAQVHYANKVYHLPAMSSDLPLQCGRASEARAWWAVIGFKPDVAPLLPLRRRHKVLHESQAALLAEMEGLKRTLKRFDSKLSRRQSVL